MFPDASAVAVIVRSTQTCGTSWSSRLTVSPGCHPPPMKVTISPGAYLVLSVLTVAKR